MNTAMKGETMKRFFVGLFTEPNDLLNLISCLLVTGVASRGESTRSYWIGVLFGVSVGVWFVMWLRSVLMPERKARR